MSTKDKDENQLTFDVYNDWPIPIPPQTSIFYDNLPDHIWTNTKAKLIRNYLNYFQWVTKHGCYIDGFAGPQYEDEHESWSAKLVLEMTPKFFRNFFLCELNPKKFKTLRKIIAEQREQKNRTITSKRADFNVWVDEILNSGAISDSVATFALLDQHTNQCHWRTVELLAKHKKGKTKIELFYFFPTGWVKRSIAKKNPEALDKWWGDDSWKKLEDLNQIDSIELMVKKFRDLEYRDISIWPIYKKENSKRILYHMIHATDHPEAKSLMGKAYKKLVATPEELKTIDMWESENLI